MLAASYTKWNFWLTHVAPLLLLTTVHHMWVPCGSFRAAPPAVLLSKSRSFFDYGVHTPDKWITLQVLAYNKFGLDVQVLYFLSLVTYVCSLPLFSVNGACLPVASQYTVVPVGWGF
ncbi:hypothetical protein L3Y34_002947 [Caenorhabditis briggsae]|uniref:Serpentine receptor class gamma n=1 Tax=Caenorhabditis briggsae TaxID=6238 RepID=A0AAE9AEB6_CAEBR|nr:hypothetical protein L3Y34_002947 [Caenorhabditis briggsae]